MKAYLIFYLLANLLRGGHSNYDWFQQRTIIIIFYTFLWQVPSKFHGIIFRFFFNGMSSLVGYLIPKPFLQKNTSDTI